ncbi:MAG: hypothetical protein R3A44_23530 [Caldilineaceae bacterium]
MTAINANTAPTMIQDRVGLWATALKIPAGYHDDRAKEDAYQQYNQQLDLRNIVGGAGY